MRHHPHFIWADLFRNEKSNRKSLIHTLKENILFSTLSPNELTYLSGLVYERIYQPQETVFEQNDRGMGVYLLAQGRVAIKTHTPQEELEVTTLSSGSFFGEIALVDPDHLRTASVVSLERSLIIGFFQPDLMEILQRKPAMGVKILLQLSIVLGQRLIETTERMTQISREKISHDKVKSA